MLNKFQILWKKSKSIKSAHYRVVDVSSMYNNNCILIYKVFLYCKIFCNTYNKYKKRIISNLIFIKILTCTPTFNSFSFYNVRIFEF